MTVQLKFQYAFINLQEAVHAIFLLIYILILFISL